MSVKPGQAHLDLQRAAGNGAVQRIVEDTADGPRPAGLEIPPLQRQEGSPATGSVGQAAEGGNERSVAGIERTDRNYRKAWIPEAEFNAAKTSVVQLATYDRGGETFEVFTKGSVNFVAWFTPANRYYYTTSGVPPPSTTSADPPTSTTSTTSGSGSAATAGPAAAPVPAQSIRLSGGQTIIVYGTVPPVVQANFTDGWLSFNEMSRLRVNPTEVSDDAGHDIMVILTQRNLPARKGDNIPGLNATEQLTWHGLDGQSGVMRLGSLSRQFGFSQLMARYGPLSTLPHFDEIVPPGMGAGMAPQAFNLTQHINTIFAEPTLARDDQSTLAQIALLHASMHPGGVFTWNGMPLPIPTAAQRSQYADASGQPYLLARLAALMGIPLPP